MYFVLVLSQAPVPREQRVVQYLAQVGLDPGALPTLTSFLKQILAMGMFVINRLAYYTLNHQVAERFREACMKHNFEPWHILPHGSYLMNSGSPNPETLRKTRETLVDELQRCEKLGLAMYNFHPGVDHIGLLYNVI